MTSTGPAPSPADTPDIKVNVRQVFGIDSDIEVPAFSDSSDHVPDLDETYILDHDTTLAILAVLPITGG